MNSPSEQESRFTQTQDEDPTLGPGQQSDADAGPDLTGAVLLDRYRVVQKLGAGGMGTVYLGEHTTIGKKCAIKVLSNEYAHRSDLVERFLQEARAASMISQQNVVEITDYGDTPDGSVFFVMEFLDGEDLGALHKRETRLPWPRVRHLMLQVCRALAAAHEAGIVHRDMKPDNCFRITRGKDEDFIKVLDFGIAKIQSGEHSGKGLTQTGMIFGTPEYMSPEQAQGAKIDHRVDIYAVGVIMYELLCGRAPFEGATFMAILTKHMFETPKAPSDLAPDAEIPPDAEAIVLKAMQKDPTYRFQDMAEMIAAIEAVGTGAGPVAVVAESIARPAGGPTSFARSSGGTAPERHVGGGAGRVGLWFGLGGFLVAAAVVGYVVFGSQGQADEGDAGEAPVAAPQEPKAEPALVVAPEPEPAPVDKLVSLHFDTNVPAAILDARDRGTYGSSDDAAGIAFPLSDEPLKLILSADGHDELEIEVVPNREGKHYQVDLLETGAAEAPTPAKRTHKRKQPATTAAEAKPEPKSDKPRPAGSRLPAKGKSDGDLKNPFAK